MEARKGLKGAAVAGALIVLLVAPVASAEVAWSIEATSDQGFGVFEVDYADGTWEGDVWTWTGQSIPIETENGAFVASLENATVQIDSDPQISMTFAVQAGTSDTIFLLRSAKLDFDPIGAAWAEATASATIGITDTDGNEAHLIGVGDLGVGAYTAGYNGWWTTSIDEFCSLINSVDVFNPYGSASMSQSYPPAYPYWEDLGVTTDSMASQVFFELTANDLASGNNTFVIVPEPTMLSLLALGGMALLRKRSR
jgi:hypothetical protein